MTCSAIPLECIIRSTTQQDRAAYQAPVMDCQMLSKTLREAPGNQVIVMM